MHIHFGDDMTERVRFKAVLRAKRLRGVILGWYLTVPSEHAEVFGEGRDVDVIVEGW